MLRGQKKKKKFIGAKSKLYQFYKDKKYFF